MMKTKITLFVTVLAAALIGLGCSSTKDSIGDYWTGFENDGYIVYGFSLIRSEGKDQFRATFNLEGTPKYLNGNTFRLISVQKFPKSDLKVVTFERADGHIYRAKLTKDGTMLIDGTRGDILGNLPNREGKLTFKKWELRLIPGKNDPNSQPLKPVPNGPEAKTAIEAAIRMAAGKPTGSLTKADLVKVKQLNLKHKQISDLTPLAELTSLESLGLFGNKIIDLKPLAGLVKLKVLDLRMNQITDAKPLAGLKELQVVRLYENQITDIKPLAGLKELKNIGLEFNKITDLTPLADLTKLEVIRLHNNNINNLTPLAGLKQAVHIDLRANAGLTKGEVEKLQKALPKCQIPNQAK